MLSKLRSLLGSNRVTQALSFTGYVLKWSLVAHVFVEYVGCIVICQGESMEPTLKTGDVILTDQVTPKFGRGLQRGDIVVLRSPTNPSENVCKRVIAVAGDYNPYSGLDLTFIHRSHRSEIYRDLVSRSSVVIPRGYIWVEGDNASNSTDSRNYGAVPIGLVRGRVFFRLLPPSLL